jgi:hypothetical protein
MTGIPPYVEDEFLPLNHAKKDFVDVLICWASRQLGKA